MPRPQVATPDGQAPNQLVRALGPLLLAAVIVNVIIGGGIFRLPATLSAHLGPASPTAFLLGALVMLPITACFAAVGSRVISTGGPYSYLQAAFGAQAGFIAGSLMWICNVASSAGIANGLFDMAQSSWPELNQPSIRAMLFAFLYLALATLNCLGVSLSGRVLVFFATLKLSPLLILLLLGIWQVDWSQIQFFAIPSSAALGSAMIAAIFAYSGIETALIPSGEVRNPATTVPRAALAATLVVILIYVGLQIICQASLGAKLIGDKTAVASAAGLLYAPLKSVILITAGISIVGFMMGNLLGSARIVYALGRDGYLPRTFGQIGKTGVPIVAIGVHAVAACSLAIAGDFDFLVNVSTGANCLIYLAVGVTAWHLQTRNFSESDQPFLLPGGRWLLPIISVASMIWILSTLPMKEWQAILAALAGLSVIYLLLRWRARTTAIR
jgi:basic amino acid/polyamine antiporter, APA family